MGVIDFSYYKTTFHGSVIPEAEFAYLEVAATDVLLAVCQSSPVSPYSDNFKRAVAYQSEMLFLQGGVRAISGLAISTSGLTEKIGDRSVGANYNSLAASKLSSYLGIPVSGLAISLLRRDGLLKKQFGEERP